MTNIKYTVVVFFFKKKKKRLNRKNKTSHNLSNYINHCI